MFKKKMKVCVGVLVSVLTLNSLFASTVLEAHAEWAEGPIVPIGTDLEVVIIVDTEPPGDYDVDWDTTDCTKSTVGDHEKVGATVEAIYTGDDPNEDDYSIDCFLKGTIVEIVSIECEWIYAKDAEIEKSDFDIVTNPDEDEYDDMAEFEYTPDETETSGEHTAKATIGTSNESCEYEVFHVEFQNDSDELKGWFEIKPNGYDCSAELTDDTYIKDNITWAVDDENFVVDAGVVTLSDPDFIPDVTSIEITATSDDFPEECSDTFTLNVVPPEITLKNQQPQPKGIRVAHVCFNIYSLRLI